MSKLLDKFSKDCKGDEDPCREYKDEEPSIKVDKIAKLITQYEKEKIAVENGCKEVRESSEKFLKLVLPQGDGKSTPVLDGNIGRLEILVNDLVEQSTSQEITVIKQLQLRKNVLEGCLEYAQFEKNVNEVSAVSARCVYNMVTLLIITFLILVTCFRDFLCVNVEGTRKIPGRVIKARYLNSLGIMYEVAVFLIMKHITLT